MRMSRFGAHPSRYRCFFHRLLAWVTCSILAALPAGSQQTDVFHRLQASTAVPQLVLAAATPPFALATPPMAMAVPPVAMAMPPMAMATPPLALATPPLALVTP